VINYKERKQRFFEEFPSKGEIYAFLKANFSGNKRLKIKFDVEERELFINEFNDADNRLIVVTPEFYEPSTGNIIIVFGLVNKYFEVELQVVDNIGPGYFGCEVKSGRKATTGRADIRFKVNADDVIATNFRISKHTIDMSMFTIPTSIKVILDQFEVQNRALCDIFEVGLLNGSKDPVIDSMRRSGKTLFIEDFSRTESFVPMNDDFIDLKEIYATEFPRYIAKCKEKGFKSIITVPLMYLNDAEQSIPFAYITMISKERLLTFEDVIAMKEKTFKLIDRIRDANTVFIEAKQTICDISKGGARLKIENADLKMAMTKARGFVFDIVFRLQAPITVYGEIKFTAIDEDKNAVIGISFTGNSSRKDEMKRFFQIMQPMELEYKKRLLIQMKGRSAPGKS
jgi:hypothetical protein